MSKTYYNNANIVLTYDTFESLIDRLNHVVGDMATSVVTAANSATPDVNSGNVYVNGYFGASNVYVTGILSGGSANTIANLVVTSEVTISNSLYATATSIGSSNTFTASNGTSIAFTFGGTQSGLINAISYSGTANNALSIGGVSVNVIQQWISGNSQTAYTNAASGIVAGVGAVSVLTFGAKGDGVTDDTTSIQNAINYAYNNGITKVIFPGAGYNFLIGGAGVSYGTFTGPYGVVSPFYRGILQLYPNIHLVGSGCRIFLSGGRSEPMPGMFYTDWWDNNNTTIFTNIQISGIEVDGNIGAQNLIYYPAVTAANVNFSNTAVNIAADTIAIPNANTNFPVSSAIQYTTDGTNVIGGLISGQIYYINYANSTVLTLTQYYGANAANINLTSSGNGAAYNFKSATDGNVWQYSDGIAIFNGQNIVIENCKIHGWQGDAININVGDGGTNIPNDIKLYNNETYSILGNGIGMTGVNFDISGNYIHGNGYWVAGMDIELGSDVGYEIAGTIKNNYFDFRDGYNPSVNTPQYASNNYPLTQTRRAISLGLFYSAFSGDTSPLNVYNEHLKYITIKDNVVFQGTMDCTNYSDVTIENNKFYNFYENLQGVNLRAGTCLTFNYGGSVVGLKNHVVTNNIIESDLDGLGIYSTIIENIKVTGNVIRSCRAGGIRFDASSGIISGNIIENVGSANTASQSNSYASGIIAYGGQMNQLGISGNLIRDTRTNSTTTNTYFSNTAVNVTSDFITLANANTLYPIGCIVNYTSNGVIGGLTSNTNYFVTYANSVGLALSNSRYGANVNLTSVGTGNNNIRYYGSTLQYGMWLNVAATPQTRIQDNTLSGALQAAFSDINGSVFSSGNHDGTYPPYWATPLPIRVGAITSTDTLVVGNTTQTNTVGGVNILGSSSSGKAVSIYNESLEQMQFQIITEPDGSTTFSRWSNGSFGETGLSFTNTGALYIQASNTKPIISYDGTHMYLANGYLYVNGRQI